MPRGNRHSKKKKYNLDERRLVPSRRLSPEEERKHLAAGIREFRAILRLQEALYRRWKDDNDN